MTFVKGQSGNPSGRAKKSNRLAGMCREHTEEAVKVLIEALADIDVAIRIKAAEQILNRGWGKAPEHITLAGDEDNPVRHKVIIELIKPNENSGSV